MLLLFILGLSASIANAESFKDGRLIGDQLDFVERNVFNLLRLGSFPQFFESSYERVRDCGCYFAPTPITFGTRIGLQCTREFHDVKHNVISDKNEFKGRCGNLCRDSHGHSVVILCPNGWSSDCQMGCFAPNFDTVEDRVDFWELTLTSLIMYGYHYVHVEKAYMDVCACGDEVKPITYGTSIGFECTVKKGEVPTEQCQASWNCENEFGQRLVTFCPAGHKATCSGCEKAVATNLEGRLSWMLDVIVGYARETLTALSWHPTAARTLACGCVGGTMPVRYGNRLGYYCTVLHVDLITEECGINILCDSPEGHHLLHFCPDGFVPSCDEGCSLPWEIKGEL